MKFLKFYILTICLLSPVLSYADDKITVVSTDDDGNTFYTYIRSEVSPNTWQSFCLPMDIDIKDLQTYFDKIYVAYNGEELEIYTDISDATDDDEIGAKRMYSMRKTANGVINTITAKNESYSLETGYWTDEEEAEDASTRYCFAYSSIGSNFYHCYIPDFTIESEIIIPQGMPFFAHVKSGVTDDELTIKGHLWENETALTGLIEKSFHVYSDLSLQTIDTDKNFQIIGSLSNTGTYTGTLYTITGDGTTSTLISSLEQYHAYIVGEEGERFLINPKTCTELENLKLPIEADDKLNLTDADPTLVLGTYKAGNIDYTRTVNNYYAGFYVPFDVDLSAMTDNFQAVYKPAGFAIYNTTTERLTTFYKDVDMTGILPAYTPFLAVMTTDNTGTQKSQDVCLKSSTITSLTSTSDHRPVAMEVYDYGTNGGLSTTSVNYSISNGGALNNVEHAKSDGYYIVTGANGSWGYVDGTLKAFREYVIIQSLSTSATKEVNIDIAFLDDSTGINDIVINEFNNAIYDICGRRLQCNKNSLPKGLYIINGKKIIK